MTLSCIAQQEHWRRKLNKAYSLQWLLPLVQREHHRSQLQRSVSGIATAVGHCTCKLTSSAYPLKLGLLGVMGALLQAL
jgi:hypothetical protein